MVAQIYLYPRIERQLDRLERQANAPAIAAQRARSIIDGLIRGDDPANVRRMQPKPDKRVKNCLKFNLGSGFRLICIRDKSCVYVMFAGDHDRCDAWLDHHSKKKPHKIKRDMAFVEAGARGAAPAGLGRSGLPAPEEKDPYMADISQDDLKRVFCGLFPC